MLYGRINKENIDIWVTANFFISYNISNNSRA